MPTLQWSRVDVVAAVMSALQRWDTDVVVDAGVDVSAAVGHKLARTLNESKSQRNW
jgi:hypothetical protein